MQQVKLGRIVRLKQKGEKAAQGSWTTVLRKIDEVFSNQQASTFIMMYHFACLGIYQNREFTLPGEQQLEPENLRFLRVFDEEKELYVWRSDDGAEDAFWFRLRDDKPAETGDVDIKEAVEARQLLWGTELVDYPNGDADWLVLTEERGIQIVIHRCLLPTKFKVNRENRLWLVTRNYIKYIGEGQASYEDSRFVKIVGQGGQVE